MGLAIIGTMTGPLLIVLNLIPDALFAGVFFVVGVSTTSFSIFLFPFVYISIDHPSCLS